MGGLGGHVAGSQAQNCVGSECQQNNANSRDVVHVQDAPGVGGSAQNCVGSKCQQNNLGGAVGGNFGSNFQTCIGSECQQNNERRKREVATREIASTAESLSSLYTPKLTRVRRQNQNCVVSVNKIIFKLGALLAEVSMDFSHLGNLVELVEEIDLEPHRTALDRNVLKTIEDSQELEEEQHKIVLDPSVNKIMVSLDDVNEKLDQYKI